MPTRSTSADLEKAGQNQRRLSCILTPRGQITLIPEPTGIGPPLSARVEQRIAEAFSAGRGAGVLHLGVAELRTDLDPTLAFWRDLGKQFVAAACGALDPTDPNSFVVPEAAPAILDALAAAVPPMRGAETVSGELLSAVWTDMGEALADEVRAQGRGVQGYLEAHDSTWNVVGRVCFHLAEQKRDPGHPFAFIATYVRELSKQAKPQYVPLSRALQAYSGARNTKKLLALLAPLQRAANRSQLIRELVDSGDIYHPLAWTAKDAHSFLCEVERFEQAGVVVRVPDWWSAAKRPRPVVSVTVGRDAPSRLGMDAMLDFDVALTLGGKRLTAREVAALLSATDGLVLIKGRWVEVDEDRLRQTLDRWRSVQAQAEAGGVSFAQAMRMLAGTHLADPAADGIEDARPEWSDVVAGEWLAAKLGALRSPEIRAEIGRDAGIEGELRPYQKIGVQWLWTLHSLQLGGCLADDMGLGKTVQVIALFSLLRRQRATSTDARPFPDLLVVPASLIENWRAEIARFAPKIRVLIAHPSRIPTRDLERLATEEVDSHDAVITTYGTLVRTRWMKDRPWRCIVLDEAQAIKNPSAKQTRAVKALQARWRLALTGTPVENRLGDLWSLFDFLNPGLLGSAKAFSEACKVMASRPHKAYEPLRKLVQPYILRRLKTDRSVITDLPEKTEMIAHCLLRKPQAALYQKSVDELARAIAQRSGIERRGLVLAFLTRLKQICNHPSQWLGDGEYRPGDSGKFERLGELCEPIAERQDKLLVFTQYREMTDPLASFLGAIFGKPGLVLHGGTAVAKRAGLVETFQESEDVPFLVLSLKAGGTGLNLTAASHVVHFDRWWNPAVENQATDRAFRIGQKRNVVVHKFVCRGTIEERIDALIAGKQQLSDELLSSGVESQLTEMSDDELLSFVSLDLRSAVAA